MDGYEQCIRYFQSSKWCGPSKTKYVMFMRGYIFLRVKRPSLLAKSIVFFLIIPDCTFSDKNCKI